MERATIVATRFACHEYCAHRFYDAIVAHLVQVGWGSFERRKTLCLKNEHKDDMKQRPWNANCLANFKVDGSWNRAARLIYISDHAFQTAYSFLTSFTTLLNSHIVLTECNSMNVYPGHGMLENRSWKVQRVNMPTTICSYLNATSVCENTLLMLILLLNALHCYLTVSNFT